MAAAFTHRLDVGQSQAARPVLACAERATVCAPFTLASCASVGDVIRQYEHMERSFLSMTTQQMDIHLMGVVVLRDIVLEYCTPFVTRMVHLDPTWVAPHSTLHFQAVIRWKESGHKRVEMSQLMSLQANVADKKASATSHASHFRTRLNESLVSWTIPPAFPPTLVPSFIKHLEAFRSSLAHIDEKQWGTQSPAYHLMKEDPGLVCRLVYNWLYQAETHIVVRSERCFVDRETIISTTVCRTWEKVKHNPEEVQTLWEWMDALLSLIHTIPDSRSLDFTASF